MIRYTSRKRRNATEQLCASQPGGSQISKSRVAAQVTYFRSASRPGGVCTLLRLPGNGSAGAGIAPLPAVQQHYSPRAKVEKRYSALTLLAAYTWEKNLSIHGAFTQTGNRTAPQDQYNPGIEKSLSPADIPQTLNPVYAYDLPFGKGRRFSVARTES